MNLSEIKRLDLIEEKMMELIDHLEDIRSAILSDSFKEDEIQKIDKTNYEYAQLFCDKYLFCSDNFVHYITKSSDYDQSKCHRVKSSNNSKFTYIDPVYFVQYVNSHKQENPRVYNSLHRMMKMNNSLKELAVKAGIVRAS